MALIGLLILFGFLALCLALIWGAAHLISTLFYRYLVRVGYAHADRVRTVSFVAAGIGIFCIVGWIFLANFRFQR